MRTLILRHVKERNPAAFQVVRQPDGEVGTAVSAGRRQLLN